MPQKQHDNLSEKQILKNQNERVIIISELIIVLTVGIISGIAPIIVGLLKGEIALGTIGFITCVVAGVAYGLLLAIPTSCVFLFTILKRNKTTKAGGK